MTRISKELARRTTSEPNFAEADDGQGLAAKLDAGVLAAGPASGAHRLIGLGDVAGQREHEGHGVLGGGDDVRRRGVDHEDAAPCGGVHVDVVDADPGPPDHLKPLAPLQQRRGDLRRAAYDEGVVIADAFFECGVVESRLDNDLEAGAAKQIGPRLGDWLSYEDAHGHPALAECSAPTGGPCSRAKQRTTASTASSRSRSSMRPRCPMRKILPESGPCPPARSTP